MSFRCTSARDLKTGFSFFPRRDTEGGLALLFSCAYLLVQKGGTRQKGEGKKEADFCLKESHFEKH